MRLKVLPIGLREAREYVAATHRHLPSTSPGWKFGLACADDSGIHGVVIVSRPVSRHLDDGLTLEIVRLATDGANNACSFLYGAAARACRALGYRRLITYTLEEESGSSLRAANFRESHRVVGRQWGCASRPRRDREARDKICWAINL